MFLQVMAAIKSDPGLEGQNEKSLMRMAMPFTKFMMDKATANGPMVLDVKLPFSEKEVLEENLEYMMRSLNLQDISVTSCDRENKPTECDSVTPGNPLLVVGKDAQA